MWWLPDEDTVDDYVHANVLHLDAHDKRPDHVMPEGSFRLLMALRRRHRPVEDGMTGRSTSVAARVSMGKHPRVLASVVAVALLATGCGSSASTGPSPSAAPAGGNSPSAPPTGGQGIDSITWAIAFPVATLDPGLVYDSGGNNNVTFTMCDSLMQLDQDLKLAPSLAASWKQTDSTTYVYTLRDGVTFWDGNTLTADDVAFSLNRILDPKLASPLAGLMSSVDKAEATGPLEVTLKLKQPDPRALWLAATPVGQVVEKAFALKQGADFGTAPDKVMCTGPYKPISWDKGAKVVLQRNDNYWDKANLPKIKQVTFQQVTDSATIVAGLKSGGIDGTFSLDTRNAQTLENDPNFSVTVGQGSSINYISPNLVKGPFMDERVRRAFSLAIDRTGLASAVTGDKYAQPLKGPTNPGLSSWDIDKFNAAYDALQLPVTPDLQTAKQLVNEAGATGTKLTIVVLEGPTADIVAPAIQQAGTSIGLDVTIKKLPGPDFFAESFSGKLPRTYDAMLNFWAPDFPDLSGIIVNQFASPFNNVEGYEDPAYRDLEKQWAQTENLSNAQADVLIKMQAMLIDKTVKIPLYVDPLVMVTTKKIGGYAATKLFYYQDFIRQLSGQ